MIELKGKMTDAIIYSDTVEQSALTQVYDFINHPSFENKKTRFMPDIHAGNGAVIGTTVELGDKIIPNVIGVDIGCGMLTVKLNNFNESLIPKLDNFIRSNIPHGFNVNSTKQDGRTMESLLLNKVQKVCEEIDEDPSRHFLSLGSLGGGNHFIELGKGDDDNFYLTIHSGSRNFGHKIASFHQRKAKKSNPFRNNMDYLTGVDAELYLKHMTIAQEFAHHNRKNMMRKITNYLDSPMFYMIESVHNYIDLKTNIIRKGAISAEKDQQVIIPFNMRDGLIIGRGKGNPDWNYSAPHGAGRVMSRSQAKGIIKLDDFIKSMEGIYSTSVNESTLDESPFVYKKMEDIIPLIYDTVEIETIVKPLYNFKA